MSSLLFATGNSSKFYEASNICAQSGIVLEQKIIDVVEIQHHDSGEITKAKAQTAYDILKRPVVVNDSSWNIPALGGFPGGYMKDVAAWLSTEDFQALMSQKKDKSIFLNEVVAYCDGTNVTMFTHERKGSFVDEPQGLSPPSFARIVMMDSDDKTIAQIFDDKNWNTESVDEYKHWHNFAAWFSQMNKEKGAK